MSYLSELTSRSALVVWLFGEASGTTATDSSGNSRDGAYVDTPTLGGSGILNNGSTAVDFDGTGDYAFLAHSAWMTVSPLSVVIRRVFDDSPGTIEMMACRWSSTSGNQTFQFRRETDGKIGLVWKDSGGTTRNFTSTGIPTTGVPYTLGFTIDANGVGFVYINGVQDGTLDPAGSLTVRIAGTAQLRVGAYDNPSSLYSDGKTAGFAMFGSALSGSDHLAIHTAALNQQSVSGGLVSTTSTALAGSIGAQTITGGLVSVAATVAAGAIIAGAIIAGGQVSTSSTVQAGSVGSGQTIAGGQAGTSSTALAGVANVAAAGGSASTASTALAGSVSQTLTGGQVSTAATVLAGSVAQVVNGGLVTVTVTVFGGSSGGLLIDGGQAVVTSSALAGTVLPGYSDSDTSNDDDAISLTGTADVLWLPAILDVPEGLDLGERVTTAHVIDEAPGLSTAFVQADYRAASTPEAYVRVIIGDEDMTYLGGAPVEVTTLRLIEPLLYGSATITLPQVNPQFETVGEGRLANIYDFAPVRLQLVLGSEIVDADYYKGFVAKISTEGSQLTLEIGGEAAGRLSAQLVRPPIYRRRQRIQHVLVGRLKRARVRARKTPVDTSIGIVPRGGADGLTIFNETLAVWAGATGNPITFVPDANGVYRKTLKDTDTIDFTAYIDEGLISQSISRDLMEEWSRVYAQGFTKSGELIANIKTPGGTQQDPIDFPLPSGVLENGMTDADTDSGAGVTVMQQQLAIQDFYDINDGTQGTFGDALEQAVRRFQRFAGLTVTGTVNLATWNRVWSLDKIGYSIDGADEFPTAEDPRVRIWNRTGNGSKAARNPLYDPHRLPVAGEIQAGGPWSHSVVQDFAESKLAPEDGIWIGTLTLRSGLVRGDHSPGDPFTSADVADRREIKPNDRIKLPYFQAPSVILDGMSDGLVFTVADVEHTPEQSIVAVANHPMPTMDFWNAMERRREAMTNRVRANSGHIRSSQIRSDEPPPWDTSSGYIANDRAMAGGEWTLVEIYAGQEGIVQRIDVELTGNRECAFVLSQKPLSIDRLNNINPLADTGDSIWTEDEDVADWFERRGVLHAWGWHQQPGGYWPGKKSNGGAITGKFRERAGFNYSTNRDRVLYLYGYIGGSDTVLRSGQILRNQRTTDF